jgi:hypothetical protein
MTTMPVHQVICNGWNHNKSSASKMGKLWHVTMIEKIPNSITTSSDTAVSYDITKISHIFTTANYKDQPKPADNVWIGISHVHLPTY